MAFITVYDKNVPHLVQVIRKPKVRTTFRLQKDNKLLVTADPAVSEQELIDFVQGHIASFAAKQSGRMARARLDVPKRIVVIRGKDFAISPVKANSTRNEKIELVNERCYVHATVLTEERVASVIKAELTRLAKENLLALAERCSLKTGLPFNGLAVKWVTGKWGHWQTATGTMLLSAQLMMYEDEVAEYVIIHELCHQQHPNHSPAFWQSVSQWVPDYKLLRLRLNGDAD